jgi:hypothetical protein
MWLPQDLIDKLKAAGKQEDRSMSWLTRKAIISYLKWLDQRK